MDYEMNHDNFAEGGALWQDRQPKPAYIDL